MGQAPKHLASRGPGQQSGMKRPLALSCIMMFTRFLTCDLTELVRNVTLAVKFYAPLRLFRAPSAKCFHKEPHTPVSIVACWSMRVPRIQSRLMRWAA